MVPQHAPPVFVDDRLIFYAMLDESMPFDHATTVELVSETSDQPLNVARIDHIPPVLGSQTITRLAAKALLRELMHASEATPKERLVDLSLKYGILCPHTAFVGVERRLGVDVNSNASMELREVSIMPGHSTASHPISSPSSIVQRCSVQYQLADVKDVMLQNLSLMLERDEKLDSLECRSDKLCKDSSAFTCSAKNLRQKRGINVSTLLHPISSLFSSFFAGNDAASSPVPVELKVEVEWPKDEQKLVERCVERQQYDGAWELTHEDVKQLTGKSLTDFSSPVLAKMKENDRKMMTTTAIVMSVLETRCISSKVLWQALSNKAHKHLTDLLQGNQEQVEQLLKDIRNHLL
jgi:hypothetical protein